MNGQTGPIIPRLYGAEDLDLEDLLALVEHTEWAYGECQTDLVLTYTNDFHLEAYPIGRAFGSEREVRWQQCENGLYDVQVIRETEWDNAAFTLLCTFRPVNHESAILLWGDLVRRHEDGQGVWVETRIPRLLHYPSESGTNVSLYVYNCIPDGMSKPQSEVDSTERAGRDLPGVIITTRWLRVGKGQS